MLRYERGFPLRRVLSVLLTAVLLAAPLQAQASVAGSTCKKLNQTVVSEGLMHRCVKSGSKLVWDAGTEVLKNFSPAPTPRITGTAQVGSTMRANAGNWGEGAAIAFQWLVGGQPIPGANDSVFVPPPALAGRQVQVMVTATRPGFNPAKKTSAASATIARPTVSARPVNGNTASLTKVGDPVASGEGKVGSPVTVDPGSWDNGVTFKYQWLRNGEAIPGATARTYVVKSEDFGSTLVARVQGSKPGFVTQVKMADPILVSTNLEDIPGATPPLVTGEALIGKQLTARVLTWGTGVALRFQWLRNGLPIAGANGGTYVLQKADINSYVGLQLIGTKAGNAPTMRLSNPIGPVLEAALVKPITGFSIPSVQGLYQVGQALTANPGFWEEAVTFAYQWNRNGAPIAGANTSTYVLTEEDLNKFITVTVTGAKQGFSSVLKTSNPEAIVKNGSFNSSGRPEVVGNRIAGQTLTAQISNPVPGAALSFQWVRQGVVIPGATERTYQLNDSDVGFTVNVIVRMVKQGFDPLTLQTADSSLVTTNRIVIAPQPSIVGTPVIGATLQVNTGAWQSGVTLEYHWQRNGQVIAGARGPSYKLQASDQGALITVSVLGTRIGLISVERVSNQFGPIKPLSITPQFSCGCSVGETLNASATGDWQGENNPTMAYQWLRGTSPISGATSARYTLTEADAGQMISVRIVLSQPGFPDATGTSVQRGPVTTNALQLTPTPTIAGTPIYLGSPLSVVTGTWDSNVTLSYRWYLDGAPISSATGTSLSLSNSTYVGKRIYVAVTGTKSGVPSVTRQSEPVTILGAKQTLTPTPVLSGTIQVGNTITANIGTWDASTVKTNRWLRDGVVIAGATGTTYVLGADDVGKIVSFEVTSTKTSFQNEVRTTALSSAVPTPQLVPVTPEVSGTALLGSTLTANPGNWGTGVTFTYVWLRNGTPIPGWVFKSYVVVADDIGSKISVRVTGSKTLYPSATATSAETSTVTSNQLTNTPNPTIGGRAKVGFSLTANTGTWDSGTSFTYQWFRNGTAISGATGASYALVVADQGAKINVAVTGKTASSLAVTRTSAESAVIESADLTNTPTPVISSNTGEFKVGATLRYSLPGFSWLTEGYFPSIRWLRNGTVIASTAEYTLVPADFDATITVRATYTTPAFSVVKTSTGVGPVAAVAATVIKQPFLIHDSVLYANSIVQAYVGDWNVSTLTYQWLKNGVAIAAPVVTTDNVTLRYDFSLADLGAKYSLRLAVATTGYSGSHTTVETPQIQPWPATPGRVSISGTNTQGSLLTATPAAWRTGTVMSYQWFRNGNAIAGATSANYIVVLADSLASITVVATGTLAGFTTVSATSTGFTIAQIAAPPSFTTRVTRDSVVLSISTVPGITYVARAYTTNNALAKTTLPCVGGCETMTLTGLASSTTWRIVLSASAPGGGASSEATATTYASLTLVPRILSADLLGDQLTVTAAAETGWRYRARAAASCPMSWDSAWVTSPTIVAMTTALRSPNGSLCVVYVEAMDPYGNTGKSSGLTPNYSSAYDPPTFRPSGSNVGVVNVQPGILVPYNISVFALSGIGRVEVTLFDKAGQQVTLPSTNRPSLASGSVWDGSYPGQLLLPSALAYGQYEVRATATSYWPTKVATYVLGTINYPDPNPPAPTASPTVSPSVPASSSPSTSPSTSPSPSPSPSTSPSPSPSSSSDSGTVSTTAVVTSISGASLGGVLVLPGALLLWFYGLLKRRREGAIVHSSTRLDQ